MKQRRRSMNRAGAVALVSLFASTASMVLVPATAHATFGVRKGHVQSFGVRSHVQSFGVRSHVQSFGVRNGHKVQTFGVR